MPGPLGLTVLTEDETATNRGTDIIFVHGIGGDSFNTWAPSARAEDASLTHFWPRWLPYHIPLARALTFGYNSDITANGFVIRDAADDLLTHLRALRDDKSKNLRSISFVCHSLGGLVVKDALVRAAQTRGDDALAQDIFKATKGIVFLATPHSASLSELYTCAEKTTNKKMNDNAMVAIRSMAHILEQFGKLQWGRLPWKIMTFCEEQPLPGTDELLVKRVQTELWDFPQISLPRHHQSISRFSSSDDPAYLKVLESLRFITLARNASDIECARFPLKENVMLQSLAVEDGSQHVGNASQHTCGWIFEHDSFKAWQEKPSQTLWISGRAGSGKSTLLKHVVQQHLDRDNASPIASFFFHHNSTSAITSLLRSLLHQLLGSTSSYVATEILARFAQQRETQGADFQWRADELTLCLLRLIENLTASGSSLYFIIDALDECEDPERVLSLFVDIHSRCKRPGSCRTWFSSRDGPSQTSAREIRMENNNLLDIRIYLKFEFEVNHGSVSFSFDAARVVQTIADKAEGAFLWASLVASNVLRVAHQTSSAAAIDEAMYLPTNLEAAYRTILGQLGCSFDAPHHKNIETALVMVLCAFRPLSPVELQSTLELIDSTDQHLRIHHSHTEAGTLMKKIDMEIRPNLPDAATQLKVLSGGLIDISSLSSVTSNRPKTAAGPIVQFVHSSVRDYILEAGCSSMKGHKLTQTLHFRMGEVCLKLVHKMTATLRRGDTKPTISTFPFLRYALSHGIRHLSLAGTMAKEPEMEDVNKSSVYQHGFFNDWVLLYSQAFGNERFKPGRTKALHVMSYFGLLWGSLDVWGNRHGDIDEENHKGQTPLSLAAAMGHYDMCHSLVEKGANVNHRDHVYGQTPLSLAAAYGHGEIVRLLLKAGSDPNDHMSGVTPLWMAVRGDDLQSVQLLLEQGSDPTSTNLRTGETALSLASAHGSLPILSLLLRYKARVTKNWDKRGWTPLHHAASRGRKMTLQLLLNNLEPKELSEMKAGLGRVQYSWVDNVLRDVMTSPCLIQCGLSEAGESQDTQQGKGKERECPKKSASTPGRKRARHEPNSESDGDDCEEDDSGTPEKRTAPKSQNGRRLACPYHKRNAEKYHTGACNGTGFTGIHRLKQHLKRHHCRVKDLQRCHICQARFPHDQIGSHDPCIRREKPTDYEDGFDAVQLQKLSSPEMNPGKSSNEHCWTAIYKVLFPDWEETRHIPSPYQDEQSRNSLDQQEILRDVRAIFCNPEVVDALRTREDVQGILQILEGGCEAFMARVRMQNSGQSESSASHPIQPQRRISSQPSIVTPAVAALPNSSIESAVSLTLLQDVPHQAVQEQETLQIPQEPFQYMPLPPPVQVNRPENHLQRQSYDGSLPHNGSAWSHYDPNFNFGFEGSDNTPFGDYDLRSSVDLGPSDDNRPLFLYGHDTMGPGVPLQFDEQDNDTRGHYSGMVVSHAVQASNPAYDSSTNSNAVQLPRATPRNGDGHAYANTSTISPVFKNNYKPGIAPYPSGVDMNCQNLSFGGRETT